MEEKVSLPTKTKVAAWWMRVIGIISLWPGIVYTLEGRLIKLSGCIICFSLFSLGSFICLIECVRLPFFILLSAVLFPFPIFFLKEKNGPIDAQ
jgi:hypothetical protein